MVALMPFIVCTARKTALTGSDAVGARSSASSSSFIVERCSRLSDWKSAAYLARSISVPRFARDLPSAEDPLHGFQHAARLERLHDEVLRARLHRLHHERLLAHRAAHQDLRVGIEARDLAHRVDAAHVGHDDVHRDEIGTQRLVALDRLYARLGLSDDLVAGFLEN